MSSARRTASDLRVCNQRPDEHLYQDLCGLRLVEAEFRIGLHRATDFGSRGSTGTVSMPAGPFDPDELPGPSRLDPQPDLPDPFETFDGVVIRRRC